MAFVCLLATSCGKSGSKDDSSSESGSKDKSSEASIVGYWLGESEVIPIQFKEDGTFVRISQVRSYDGEVSYFFDPSKYKVDGNKLIATKGEREMSCTFEINGDELTIYSDGETEKAKRITEDEYKNLTKNVLDKKPE